MRSTIISALVCASTFVPLAAGADGLSYSYGDIAYVSTDVDGFNEEVDGFALRGSVAMTEQAFLFGRYTDQSTSIFGEDLEFRSYDVGAGYAWPIADATDLYGKFGYTKVEAEFLGQSADDDGFTLGAGLRGRVAEQFELEGSISYVDLSESGDDTMLGLGARWFFTEQFAAGVEGEFGDDASTYGIGLRLNFGR